MNVRRHFTAVFCRPCRKLRSSLSATVAGTWNLHRNFLELMNIIKSLKSSLNNKKKFKETLVIKKKVDSELFENKRIIFFPIPVLVPRLFTELAATLLKLVLPHCVISVNFVYSLMEPADVEFLAENELVSIIPNFNYSKIFLVSGEVGPFRAGLPLKVPIWLAINLKSRQKCRIVAPDWMDLEKLEELKEEEIRSEFFCKMPSEYYIIETQLLLNVAEGDIPRSDALRTIIKDIWDKRLAKLRTSVDTFIKVGGTHAKLDHLTSMEINSIRPLLPHALDLLNRMHYPKSGTYSQSSTPSSSSSLR